MRITVVSAGDVTTDPAAPPLIHSLTAAGHEVSLVGSKAGVVGGVSVQAPPDPQKRRTLGRSQRDPESALGKLVLRTKPDIIHPIRKRDLAAAMASKRGLITRGIEWRVPADRDLIERAPHDAAVSQPVIGSDVELFYQATDGDGSHPIAGRHAGRKIALVYRHTSTSPGRYLATALERSGADVVLFDGRLDWADVAADTAAVVFVESPYPAMEITGSNPGIPVLFWVHHGEHHLNANLRLVDRYGADAVLLAHSWHLAHRFPVPVHRFPFGVAPELFTDTPTPFGRRTTSVAMVGAGIEKESPRYADRYVRIHDLRQEFGSKALFRSNVPPEAMAALYSNAQVVVNDGGARHYPITMRVFEAVGAGALLATDPIPGTDLLFEPGAHYEELSWTVAARLREVLADPATARRAEGAYEHAMTRHTYDHRVDDLLLIADSTRHQMRTVESLSDPLDRLVSADVEVSTVAIFGTCELSLPDREARNGTAWMERGTTGRFDAAIVAAGDVELARVAAAVRRYIYVVGVDEHAALTDVRRLTSKATATTTSGVVRIDVGAPGYVVRGEPQP